MRSIYIPYFRRTLIRKRQIPHHDVFFFWNHKDVHALVIALIIDHLNHGHTHKRLRRILDVVIVVIIEAMPGSQRESS